MAFPVVGRKVGLYDVSVSPAVLVAGARGKTISINNESIDITSDDDAGYRTLLSDPAVRSIDLSIEGVAKNADLLTAATASDATLLLGYELRIEGVGTVACDFYLSSVELGAPYNEAVTFSASLQSSGVFTFTPAT